MVMLRSEGVRMRAIRGATTVACDDPALIGEAVCEMLGTIVGENGLETDQIVSAWFTTTPDLRSVFPAAPARAMGWTEIPMMCASEIDVAGAQPRCIRVMLHVERPVGAAPVRHVYLREAIALRPDLCRGAVVAAQPAAERVLAAVGGAL